MGASHDRGDVLHTVKNDHVVDPPLETCIIRPITAANAESAAIPGGKGGGRSLGGTDLCAVTVGFHSTGAAIPCPGIIDPCVLCTLHVHRFLSPSQSGPRIHIGTGAGAHLNEPGARIAGVGKSDRIGIDDVVGFIRPQRYGELVGGVDGSQAGRIGNVDIPVKAAAHQSVIPGQRRFADTPIQPVIRKNPVVVIGRGVRGGGAAAFVEFPITDHAGRCRLGDEGNGAQAG